VSCLLTSALPPYVETLAVVHDARRRLARRRDWLHHGAVQPRRPWPQGSPGGVSIFGGVAVYAALMFGVCLIPSITPVRRVLWVDATEALRAEV
jgi:hypothetical protein